MVERLSARAAAELCGVDERTVRRWSKSGQLAADKQGGRFLIPRSALEPFLRHSNGHERTAAAERTLPDTDAAAGVLKLVRLVDRLQRENRTWPGWPARYRNATPISKPSSPCQRLVIWGL